MSKILKRETPDKEDNNKFKMVEYLDDFQFEQLDFTEIISDGLDEAVKTGEKPKTKKKTRRRSKTKVKKSKALEFEQLTVAGLLEESKESELKSKEIKEETSDTESIKADEPNETIELDEPAEPLEEKENSKTSFLGAYTDKENKEIADKVLPYKSCECILTNAESQLFHYMLNFIKEDVVIFSKVRMADIVEVDRRITEDENKRHFYSISSKHLDFVLCDAKTLEVICVVELDDFYHDKPDNKKRDKFKTTVLDECKIPFVRIKTRIVNITEKDMEEIDGYIKEHFAPKCPKCGGPTVVRQSHQRHNIGHRFYGCMKFPSCDGTIDID